MDDKDLSNQDQAVVDQEAAAADSDQAQSASTAAVSKANEAIKQATAAVQAAGKSQSNEASNETASAVSAATAAASAAKAASEAAEAASAVAAEVSEGETPEQEKRRSTFDRIRRYLEYFRQTVLIIVSLVLLYFLTEDILRHGIPLDVTEQFLEIQFWICIFFLADIIFGIVIHKDRRRFILNNLLFFIVSIPYLPLLMWSGVHLRPELLFVLKLVPMARGAFALSIVLGWLIYDKASTLFVTYVTVLFTLIYLSSIAFYTSEHGVNPLVHDYSDALWWACMDVTTVGCNIEAMTLTGKILSVVLASAGMMMLPLFTVYITSLLAKKPDFSI